MLAEDANNLVVTNFSGSETLSLAAGPAGTLGGTLTVSAASGVATFGGLTLSPAGSDYQLGVSGDSLTGTSNTFTVVPVPAAGSEFQVNAYTAGSQDNPKVASDSAGDYVLVGRAPARTAAATASMPSSTMPAAESAANSRSTATRRAISTVPRWPWIPRATSSSPG